MSDQAGGRGLEAGGAKAPRWAWWVATGFGSGYLKPAPGTWGSLAALVAWILVMQVLTWLTSAMGGDALTSAGQLAHPFLSFLPLLATLAGAWAWIRFGIPASTLCAHELGQEDPGLIVIDEWAGLWISLVPVAGALPFSNPLTTLRHWADLGQLGYSPWEFLAPVLLAFLAFRLLDIWKPWPCREIQILPDGEGIMADDVVAGLYAAIPVLVLLQLSKWHLIPWPIPRMFWHH
ncbi:MAG TPA: phosphatidylglycerophosphatase A [Holophagaceae bacterium]|nr:phosphatidylglycerophosphatase A [Holophagaceae bacterium]